MTVIYPLCFLLILIGLLGVLVQRSTVKIIIGLLVMEYGIHLLLVLQGYRHGGLPPIADAQGDAATLLQRSVDPLPQALVLTSIVIGLGVVMLMVALAHRIHQRYGTLDTNVLHRLRG